MADLIIEELEFQGVKIDDKQKYALDMVHSGKNIFITGSAGTGKSFVINLIQKLLTKTERYYELTASTGIAAVNINGKTLHCLFGMKLAKDNIEELISIMSRRKLLLNMWKTLEVLIIDEISMLNIKFFKTVSKVISFIKENEKPFGGIQIILVGDFLQLPPIDDKKKYNYKNPKQNLYLFQTEIWETLELEIVLLQNLYRNSNIQFNNLLGKIRRGKLVPKDLTYLNRYNREIDDTNSEFKRTMLYPYNAMVDNYNRIKLMELATEEYTFKREIIFVPLYDDNDLPYEEVNYYIEMESMNTRIEDEIKLKVGAQVMLTVNKHDLGLYNGLKGKVMEITEKGIVILFENETVHTIKNHRYITEIKDVGKVITRQIPLKLAWAITIHKSQGCSIKKLKIDFTKKSFVGGLGYVALSRSSCPEELQLVNYTMECFKQDPEVVEYYKYLESRY
jgi:ATP-dependent DNA helicase PIF1